MTHENNGLGVYENPTQTLFCEEASSVLHDRGVNEERRRSYIDEHNKALSQLDQVPKHRIAEEYRRLISKLWELRRPIVRFPKKRGWPAFGSPKKLNNKNSANGGPDAPPPPPVKPTGVTGSK